MSDQITTATEVGIDLAQILSRQKKTSLAWRQEPLKNRIKRLKSLRKWVQEHRSEISKAVFNDFRKPETESDLSETWVVLSEIRHAINHLKTWTRPQPITTPLTYLGTRASLTYEPRGASLIIGSWNFPVNLTLGPMISALAAGCPVVLKPSEISSHTSKVIRKMAEDLFDPDEVYVVEGGPEVATELLRLPFDHIFFTGSTSVGRIVMKAAAENLTSVTLELGGKTPVLVDESASIRDAGKRIAWGKLLNNGQSCTAADFLFVHESIRDSLIDEVAKEMKKIFDHGDVGFRESPDYSRIINERHYKRVSGYIEDAIEKGATVAFGGKTDTGDRFIEPTILTDVDPEMLVMKEEVFGPVLPVMTFSRMDEAIEYINAQPKPLGLYVFSKRRNVINKVLKSTTAGSVVVNDGVIHFTHGKLPFGGVNSSGFGNSHGIHGFKAFSNLKPVLRQRSGMTIASLLYPPYTRFKQTLTDLLIRYF